MKTLLALLLLIPSLSWANLIYECKVVEHSIDGLPASLYSSEKSLKGLSYRLELNTNKKLISRSNNIYSNNGKEVDVISYDQSFKYQNEEYEIYDGNYFIYSNIKIDNIRVHLKIIGDLGNEKIYNSHSSKIIKGLFKTTKHYYGSDCYLNPNKQFANSDEVQTYYENKRAEKIAKKNKEKEDLIYQSNADKIETCKELGFKKATEGFKNCVLELN